MRQAAEQLEEQKKGFLQERNQEIAKMKRWYDEEIERLKRKRDKEERLLARKRDEEGAPFQKKVKELWEIYNRRRREVNEERRQLFPEKVIPVEVKIKENNYREVNYKLAALPKREEVTDLSVTTTVQPSLL